MISSKATANAAHTSLLLPDLRAEVRTPKYIANKIKSKGLWKLRWYCLVCEQQCSDENGFECHISSKSHLRQMLSVCEHACKHIVDFSAQFQSELVKLLSRRFGTKRVKANTVYQEYIQDKQHLHMNSTRWVTLTEFIKHLGRSGIAHVDETEKGWFIAWIDSSPKALAKQAAAQMKERSTMSDEQRERLLIAEQIERAEAEKEVDDSEERAKAIEEGLKRDETSEKVVLTLKPKTSPPPPATEAIASITSAPESPPTTISDPSAPSSTSAPAVKVGFNAFKTAQSNSLKPTGINPLKKNVFKLSATSSVSTSTNVEEGKAKRKEPVSVAEQLILEDQQRKRRKMDRDALRS